MTLGIREILHRYVGRCVSIQSHTYRRYIGKLTVVMDDYIVLNNVNIFDDYEGSRWQDEIAHHDVRDGVEVGFSETVISMNTISAITSSDTEGLAAIAPDSPEIVLADPVESDFGSRSIMPAKASIELFVGCDLGRFIRLHDTDFDLLVSRYRDLFKRDFCIELPQIQLRISPAFEPNQYSIVILDTPRDGGDLEPYKMLAVGPHALHEGLGTGSFQEPCSGLHATWIEASQQEQARQAGLHVLDAMQYLLRHLHRAVFVNLSELFSYTTTCAILREANHRLKENGDDFFRDIGARIRLHQTFIALIRDGVRLSCVDQIIEAVALTRMDPDCTVYEFVRSQIVPYIVQPAVNSQGYVTRLSLDREIAKELPCIIQCTELLGRLIESLQQFLFQYSENSKFVLVVPDEDRQDVCEALAQLQPSILVISNSELRSLRLRWRFAQFSTDQFCGVAELHQHLSKFKRISRALGKKHDELPF